MKCLLLFLLFASITAAAFGRNRHSLSPKIFGGEPLSIQDVPYTAVILYRHKIYQGAAIISENWLVSTATQLYPFYNKPYALHVVTGIDYLDSESSPQNIREIREIIIHDEHDNHNIALIKVGQPISFDAFQDLIPLAWPSFKLRVGDVVMVSAIGHTTSKKKKVALRTLDMKLVDLEAYHGSESSLDSEKDFVAIRNHSGVCPTDSGAPAVINGMLVGVAYYGRACSSDYKYKVDAFAEISYYYDWIVSYVPELRQDIGVVKIRKEVDSPVNYNFE